MTNATAERAVTFMQVMVRDYKSRGLKQPDCFAAIARWLGVKPRRVRAVLNNEAARIAEDEYRAMIDGWNRYLDHRAANLAQELVAIQARKAAR